VEKELEKISQLFMIKRTIKLEITNEFLLADKAY
jgi:hypothetical protein